MQFKNDFMADWYIQLRELLKTEYGIKQGLIDKITDEELPFTYMNVEMRRIPQKPRRVHISNEFSCPQQYSAGWHLLKKKIINGDDLTPHLSTLNTKPDYKDKMLSDWGVFHFHLGTTMEKGYINRTGPLVYAFVHENDFYAVNVYTHSDWTEDSVLDTVHENWPHVLSNYIIKGIIKPAVKFTPEERAKLRKSNGNSLFTAADGTIYAPPGGGIVSSGHSLNSVQKVFKTKDLIKQLSELANNPSAELHQVLLEQGFSEHDVVEAKLIITTDHYKFLYPAKNLLVTVISR